MCKKVLDMAFSFFLIIMNVQTSNGSKRRIIGNEDILRNSQIPFQV